MLRKNLHNLIPRPCFNRPFVCDGFPDSCDVIVIGENPATKVDTDWWTFWDDEDGFNLCKFEQAYEMARLAGHKRPISNTRLRLNRLRRAGLRCLETNIFGNQRLKGPGLDASSNSLLPMFLEHLPHLKAVIAHGSVAGKYLHGLKMTQAVRSFYLRHFRSESYDRIDSVAQEILGHRRP